MKQIIDEYVMAYNQFDVDGMIRNIHKDIEFRNTSNGEVNVQLKGKYTLKKQAEQSADLFEKREMKIIEQKIKDGVVENKIEFYGVFAIDIPDGPQTGETVKIEGKSIFKFKEGKIILIEDIS